MYIVQSAVFLTKKSMYKTFILKFEIEDCEKYINLITWANGCNAF